MLKNTLQNISTVIKRHKFFQGKSKLSDLIPAIVLHGGVSQDFTRHAPDKMSSMISAVNRGFSVLTDGGSSVDAVETTMVIMEDNADFNVGYGSMLNSAGEVEVDSCIMYGGDLRTGAVGCISNVKNPVKVARRVMEYTPHVLLCCQGAQDFAKKHKFEILKPGALVADRSKKIMKERGGGDIGNAGVVAIDIKGRLAAAVGNGGTVGRVPGTLTESCRTGCGVYADDLIGAVCVTGDSDQIMKYLLAYSMLKSMEAGLSPIDAMDKHIRKFHSMFGKPAGAIGFNRTGEVGIHFTSHMMPWAYRSPSAFIYGHTLKELPQKYRSYPMD